MLVELSKSQDIEAGDGTTSVCVIAGALLNACTDLLAKGIHPMAVAESFLAAADKAEEILESMSTPVDLTLRYIRTRNVFCFLFFLFLLVSSRFFSFLYFFLVLLVFVLTYITKYLWYIFMS